MTGIKSKSVILVLLIVAVVILVLLQNSHIGFFPFKNISVLNEVASLISSKYVNEVEKEKLMRDGINGMMSDLDPYSEYLEKGELEGLLETSKGEFEGIGIEIVIKEDYPVVVSPLEGTPAYDAGIKSGDKIIKVNDLSTIGLSGDETQQRIRGRKGSTVKLTILREGIGDPLEFNLKRDVIEIKSIAFAGELEDGIEYIRMTRFSENSPAELKVALNNLRSTSSKGLILDLRGNPGGLLEEAIKVAEFFVKQGELVLEIRGREISKKIYSQSEPIFDKSPLIVLIDFGSASASEIVAGVIQDLDRGLILGDTSFGKGAVQTLFELDNNTALKLTTAYYYIPSGRLIQKNVYTHEDPGVDTVEITDTLQQEKVFYTRKGRKVYGGGGIVPDILVLSPDFSPLIQELLRNQYFFDFALHYAVVHKGITENFQADEKVLKEFKDFIKSRGFDYKSQAESELGRLKETITNEEKSNFKDQYSDGIKEAFHKLSSLLSKRKESDFEKNKEVIKWQIEEAIITKEFGPAARYKVWARYQEQIKKAIKILKDKEEYERLLTKPSGVS